MLWPTQKKRTQVQESQEFSLMKNKAGAEFQIKTKRTREDDWQKSWDAPGVNKEKQVF